MGQCYNATFSIFEQGLKYLEATSLLQTLANA